MLPGTHQILPAPEPQRQEAERVARTEARLGQLSPRPDGCLSALSRTSAHTAEGGQVAQAGLTLNPTTLLPEHHFLFPSGSIRNIVRPSLGVNGGDGGGSLGLACARIQGQAPPPLLGTCRCRLKGIRSCGSKGLPVQSEGDLGPMPHLPHSLPGKPGYSSFSWLLQVSCSGSCTGRLTPPQ